VLYIVIAVVVAVLLVVGLVVWSKKSDTNESGSVAAEGRVAAAFDNPICKSRDLVLARTVFPCADV
jgi:hypothetical protein